MASTIKSFAIEVNESITPLDAAAMEQARERQDVLTKPQGSLGVLEDISVRLAGIYGKSTPKITGKAVIVMAADHGVVAEGVSAFPQAVTEQMVYNFAAGGAAINVLSRHAGAEVYVVDIGVVARIERDGVLSRKVRPGTGNMALGPAMSVQECEHAIRVGMEVADLAISAGANILATGDMGIGNTTASSAVVAVLAGRPVAEVLGRGTGIDDEGLNRKLSVIEKALEMNKPDPASPIDVLAKVGGLEIAGICGVILQAAKRRVPVVVDGFISGAGALVAARLAPESVNYMIASHVSVEPGHRIVLQEIGIQPMLHMNMRLGEGSGAVLALSLIEAAVKVLAEMATFAEAEVSESDKEE